MSPTTRELKVSHDALTPEVAWLNKMYGTDPQTAVIQVTALLGSVMLRRTDYNQYREATIPAQGIEQAEILVDAAKLADALKSVSGTLTLSIGDGKLVITDATRTVKLRAADLDYLAWPTFQSTAERAPLGAVQLGRVLTSVGNDDTLPQLMVVAFDKGAMVTTDRFRLTRIGYSSSGFVAKVPAAVLKAFAKADGVVYVEPGRSATADWVKLSAGNRSVLGATSDSDFPKWRQLIPSDPPIRVSLRRDDLLNATSGEEVTLTVDGDTDEEGRGWMTVCSTSDDLEVEQKIRTATIRHDYDGPLTVTLRSKYVKECLKAVGSGMVLFDATESQKPVMFQDIAENDLHLIMPVRTAS